MTGDEHETHRRRILKELDHFRRFPYTDFSWGNNSERPIDSGAIDNAVNGLSDFSTTACSFPVRVFPHPGGGVFYSWNNNHRDKGAKWCLRSDSPFSSAGSRALEIRVYKNDWYGITLPDGRCRDDITIKGLFNLMQEFLDKT